VANLWDRLKDKANSAIATQGAGIVRNKVAARDVFDDFGNLLVGAGRTIDDEIIDRATAAGKMPALLAAVAAAKTQDFRDHIQSEIDRTPEGQDRRSLADSEDYIEARRYINYVAAVEVTDIRGTVLVAAGSEIHDEDVRRVREAGQLAALIYSAQQSPPPIIAHNVGPLPPRDPSSVMRRTAVPLGESFESGEDE